MFLFQGLCKQTKGFKAECLSIVDEYYDVIYSTLVKDLNEKEACCLMEICPRGLKNSLSGVSSERFFTAGTILD